MKTRNGFVSNSSSSSFVVVATVKAHEKAISKLKPEKRKIVEMATSYKKIGTQEMVLIAGHFNSEDGGYSYSDNFTKVDNTAKDVSDNSLGNNHEDGYPGPYTDAMEEYISVIQKDKEASTLSMY